MSQLAHRCILADFLNGILLNYLPDRLRQEEACGLEPLIRVPVIQLKNLVKGLLGNLSDALAESPLVESLFNLVALLDLLHVRKNDQRGAKEFVLSRAI